MKAILSITLLTSIFILSNNSFSLNKFDKNQPRKLYRNSAAGQQNTLININNISMWIGADGESAFDPFQFKEGTFFPRQTSNIIYQDGLIWGGKINDGISPLIRVGGQTYRTGTVPGAILWQGVAEDPFDNENVNRIWRVRRDFDTADLTQDAAELYQVAPEQVTAAQINEVRDQYEQDWLNWPAHKGAPFYDADNDGIYTPVIIGGNPLLYPAADEPGLAEADQVVYLVANDLDQGATLSLFGSPPIGMEMQLTLWGYHDQWDLDNVIFKRYRLIYKGRSDTPVGAFIDSMYFCQWSDPDIGEMTDDLVGSDTTLSLGYAYNGASIDDNYVTYNLTPPAAGYDFLQGPVVPDPGNTAIFDFKELPEYRNLPMTSFVYFVSGAAVSDPEFSHYDGTLQFFNVLRGFMPRPISPPYPWIDPNTDQITKYLVPGDPVTGNGWIDGFPADHRMLLASGPFTMALGDTQEVIIGLMAGLGESHLLSINKLKQIDRSTQAFCDSKFKLVLASLDVLTIYESTEATRVFLLANIIQSATAVNVTFTDTTGNCYGSMALFDDGSHNDIAAGDGIFANELFIYPQFKPLDINITVQTSSGIFEFEKYRKITTVGPLEILNLIVRSDNLNNDGKINPGENVRMSALLFNGSAYDFDQVTTIVTYEGPVEYSNNREQNFLNVEAGAIVSTDYDATDPNTYTSFQVSPNAQDEDMIIVNITMFDLNGNIWQDHKILIVKAFETKPEMHLVNHVSGPGDGTFGINIINPAALTDHTYRITINNPPGSQKMNLINMTRGDTLLKAHALPDEYSHNMPIIDGFKITRGTLEFNFGFAQLAEVAYAGQTIDPPDSVWHSANSDGSYMLSAGGGDGAIDRLTRYGEDSANLGVRDLELRFTDQGGQGLWPYDGYGTETGYVPFEIWDIGIGTPNDTTDDARLIPSLLNRGTACIFDVEPESHDPYSGFPITDWIYFNSGDYDAFETDALDGNLDNSDILGLEYLSRLVFVDRDQNGEIPPAGTTIRITTFKSPTSNDVYEFTPRYIGVTGNDESELQRTFTLFQNYPNPFNPETSIRYVVPTPGQISLEIYNILGQKLKTLVNKKQEPGEYTVNWNGTNELGQHVSSGIYVYRFKGDGFIKNRKMLLIK